MSWLNKSLSQLTDVTSSISKFTEDVLAAEPPGPGEDDGGQLAEYRRQLGTGLSDLVLSDRFCKRLTDLNICLNSHRYS